MARRNQGGAVLGFVVVAIIMAGLLIGGVYAMRQLTAQPSQGLPAPETAKEDAPTDKKKTEAPASDQKDKTTDNKTVNKTPQVQTSELPKTGPESLFSTIIMLGILSAAAVSYVRSRRLNLAL
jgi:LPXTG-motif cell wall-anchored protein